MFDKYVLFAVVSVVFALLRYGSYFYKIYIRETKPHVFSWFLWGVISGIGTFAQFILNAGPSAWALGFVSFLCFFIAFVSISVGEKSYTKSDWLALFASIIAILIWHLTDNPVMALYIIVVIEFLSYWPTIRKSYLNPYSEPSISYFFAGIRNIFMLLAIPNPTIENIIYPAFLMVMDLGFALYLVIRRGQICFLNNNMK